MYTPLSVSRTCLVSCSRWLTVSDPNLVLRKGVLRRDGAFERWSHVMEFTIILDTRSMDSGLLLLRSTLTFSSPTLIFSKGTCPSGWVGCESPGIVDSQGYVTFTIVRPENPLRGSLDRYCVFRLRKDYSSRVFSCSTSTNTNFFVPRDVESKVKGRLV